MTLKPIFNADVEITPEMIEAGEDVILGVVGGADLGGFFSARDLAIAVYRAMESSAGSPDTYQDSGKIR